jgi:putative restriction endonuclease
MTNMHAFVGVTDLDWYLQLATNPPEGGEANFWFPSARQSFAALQPGEIFLFKTHVERRNPSLSNRIVGGGIYSGYARLLVSEAWSWFQLANGTPSRKQLLERVALYRRAPFGPFEDPEIGCVILRDVVFFEQHETVAAPEDFRLSIVKGKRYNLEGLTVDPNVTFAVAKYVDMGLSSSFKDNIDLLSAVTRGTARLTVPRVGQQAFKAVVAEAYHHHCALTGDKVRPVLEAAHILPVSEGGQHRVDNGLLLRSDMHRLFDDGFIGLDSKYRLRVSPAIRERFGNGDWLYSREGEQISVPDRLIDRPNAEFLEWHADTVFIDA